MRSPGTVSVTISVNALCKFICTHYLVNISYVDGSGEDAVLMKAEQVCTWVCSGSIPCGRDHDCPARECEDQEVKALQIIMLYELWIGERAASIKLSVKVDNASRNETVSTLEHRLLLLIWYLQCLMQ